MLPSWGTDLMDWKVGPCLRPQSHGRLRALPTLCSFFLSFSSTSASCLCSQTPREARAQCGWPSIGQRVPSPAPASDPCASYETPLHQSFLTHKMGLKRVPSRGGGKDQWPHEALSTGPSMSAVPDTCGLSPLSSPTHPFPSLFFPLSVLCGD